MPLPVGEFNVLRAGAIQGTQNLKVTSGMNTRSFQRVLVSSCLDQRGAAPAVPGTAPRSHRTASAQLCSKAEQRCKDNIDLKFKSNVVT